jgi:NAD(P)-dependent dehydrogenase (short-subunit alcohol dehydrogenase family)
MSRFQDKVFVVVGGNSGIGLSAAQLAASEGAQVVITGRDEKTLQEAANSIDGAIYYRADIGDVESMAPVAEDLKQRYGKVDALFVNAGVGGFAMVDQVTPEMWDQVNDVNCKGAFFAIQKMLPIMADGGSIVLTGSVGSTLAIPGNVSYAASKAGLRAVARILAKELIPRGIRVNMISPGPIETPLLYRNPGMTEEDAKALKAIMISNIPMGRMGESDEVAKAALFLASSESSFINGVDLAVDGGCIEL